MIYPPNGRLGVRRPPFALGLGLGATGGTSWSPPNLSNLVATVLPALSRARGLLWQDTAQTVPAVASGEPVRVAVCPFTGALATAPSDAQRGVLATDGNGNWGIVSNGSTTGYVVGSTALTGAAFLGFCAAQTYTSTPQYNRILNCVGADSQQALWRNGNQGQIRGTNTFNPDYPLATDTNYHTVTLSQASGGQWAATLDGSALSTVTTPLTVSWGGVPCLSGPTGTQYTEPFSGTITGAIFAASNVTGAALASAIRYLAATALT